MKKKLTWFRVNTLLEQSGRKKQNDNKNNEERLRRIANATILKI